MQRSISPRLAATLLTLAQTMGSLPALAQAADAPKPVAGKEAVVPPKLTQNATPEYPEQAIRDHVTDAVVVGLVLDINVDGTVRSAKVETPVGHGFDEAAVAAAQKLLFEPARRGEQAVAARIRFQFQFPARKAVLIGRIAQQNSESDAPIGGARVTLKLADGTEQTVSTGPDGSWRAADLPPGAVHMTVDAPGYRATVVDEQLAAGEETTVVVRLPALTAEAKPATPETKPGAPPELEILVEGERPPREVTKRTLQRAEIETIPGTNGDALRAIQNLPGVARPPAFLGLLIVRGSAPQDTLIFVDGTEIPLVYHFGAFSAVVPTEVLEKIDFYPGNYSAQYGRGQAGMVDVGIRDPKSDRLHGMAQLDLIDARMLAEGPIGKTGWNFLLGGRRSWLDVWLKPVLESADVGVTAAPRYYDYQVMAQRKVGSHGSFRLLFFGADDTLEILNKSPGQSNPQFGGTLGFHTSFWRVQARYKERLDAQTELRVTGAVGRDSIDVGFGSDYFTLTQTPMTLRTELSRSITRGVRANVGIDMSYAPYDVTVRFPRIPRPGEPGGGPGDLPVETTQTSKWFLPGAYTELELIPWRGGRIVPGARLDYANNTKKWDFAPRINVRQDLTNGFPRTTLKGGAGLFYQPPNPGETDPVFGQPGIGSYRAIHYDVGFEQEFTQQIELSTDVYYKHLDDQVVQGGRNGGVGRAWGVEWLLRYKPDERFFGWLAYTLARSERREYPNYPMHLSEFDQTHILTAIASYQLGRGWRLGGRFRFVSGSLYTPLNQGAYDATTGTTLSAPSFPPFETRLPAFNQLDIRVDKVWTFKDWKLTAYLDVQNVLNRKNAEGVAYNYNYTRSTQINGLPILPILGIRGEF